MHVAVTGASSGLGEAIAREYAAHGADVTLVARRRAELERVANDLRTRTHVVTCDLTDVDHAADWIDEAEAALGPIDVLVSNAGLLTLGAVVGFEPEAADRMIAVNFLGPLRLVQAVLPRMVARKKGSIVLVTSAAAIVTMPGWAYQAASKAAASTFGEALGRELRGTGVHALTVYPGLTDTPMTQGGIDAYGRKGLVTLLPLGNAPEMAGRLRRAVEGRRATMFYPRYYRVLRWFPRLSQLIGGAIAPRLPG